MVRSFPVLVVVVSLLSACSSGGGEPAKAPAAALARPPLPGMPVVRDPANIYADAGVNMLSPRVKGFPEYVYVPNNVSNTVDVIDQKTFKIVNHFRVGKEPQHVVPSYDFQMLYATNDLNNTLTEIDPKTGEKLRTLKIEDPYNMYYTPDGKYAIVVAERLRRLDFREPGTFKMVESVPVPCKGVDHLDFSADGTYLIASCEFSAQMVKVDVQTRKVLGLIDLPRGGMPQDVKLSPDGKVFYVADMKADGLHLIDGEEAKVIGFLPTGKGAHGLYPSRDAKVMYVSNRGEGSVSLVDFATRKVVGRWEIPGGGSPDMGGLSADGKVFWLSGRYHGEVYAFGTSNGKLLARIKVGRGPHGLCVFPQPGRYSIGHTGNTR